MPSKEMSVKIDVLESIIFKTYDRTVIRFLQNSPIYPSVWLAYAMSENPRTDRIDLIFTPHLRSSASELFHVLRNIANDAGNLSKWELATNAETIAAKLTFEELILEVLPLTSWWLKINEQDTDQRQREASREHEWLQLVVGVILAVQLKIPINELTDESKTRMRDLGREFLLDRRTPPDLPEPLLWSVSNNRKATISVTHSVPCTKADAGRRLFDIDGASISWAVVDSGIDAEHPAFRKIDPATKRNYEYAMTEEAWSTTNFTRVVATYDFTQFRKLVSELTSNTADNDNDERLLVRLPTGDKQDRRLPVEKKRESMRAIETALNNGRMLDWTVLAPLLRIPHSHGNYKKPLHPHGTHVAGIIGAGMVEGVADSVLVGMCPRINLYDFRVLDQNGEGDEFNIIAALQFIRWINQHDGLSIHGVNLSMSLYHDVETYACGHTPVCTSANRLVEEGIVVVAAAGNQGQSLYQSDSGITSQGFRTVNITDPGNAEDVITVGATHRNEPHRYGVSYFSSKGPTGDGRIKPDLVAPGEKIYSAVLNEGIDAMDGTSMAAPHVSGAAALVMSKHRELIGRPRRIKDILCKTATDLGRERYFQGCGMVDVLRAIQSV